MLLVDGKPILEYTIDFLPEEINEFIIVVNHLGAQIREYFGEYFKGRKIKYVVQEKLNGTGGALQACKDQLSGKFMVVMGDDLYYKKDLEKILTYDLAILAYEVEDSTRFGVLKTDAEGRLIEIIEKPKLKERALISTNAFVLNDKFFNYDLVPISETEFGLPQTLAKMAKDYPVDIVKATRWLPVGYPEDIEKAQEIIDKFI
ncbi:MAG: nucleotidyltransferase family protein, partial [Candidatus Moranbacteria bacterium]|nr:nucleotidyltransferase family protein [Candidatus Moranbacteria bacterium]